MDTIICPNCDTQNKTDANFCRACGYPLQQTDATAQEPETMLSSVEVPTVPSSLPETDLAALDSGENIYCARCGHENRSWCTVCEHCKAPLLKENVTTKPDWTHSPNRPGCVTIYAILLILGAIANGVTAVSSLPNGASFGGIYSLLLAIGGIVVAIGLWQQKNWGRIGVIVLMALSTLMLGLEVILSSISTGIDLFVCGMSLVFAALPAFIMYWFAKHREYFT